MAKTIEWRRSKSNHMEDLPNWERKDKVQDARIEFTFHELEFLVDEFGFTVADIGTYNQEAFIVFAKPTQHLQVICMLDAGSLPAVSIAKDDCDVPPKTIWQGFTVTEIARVKCPTFVFPEPPARGNFGLYTITDEYFEDYIRSAAEVLKMHAEKFLRGDLKLLAELDEVT